MLNVNRTIAQIALSLYASARKVERLPRVTTHEPTDTVQLVAVPAHLRPALALASLVSPRFEVL